jgi:hypothetical protein
VATTITTIIDPEIPFDFDLALAPVAAGTVDGRLVEVPNGTWLAMSAMSLPYFKHVLLSNERV